MIKENEVSSKLIRAALAVILLTGGLIMLPQSPVRAEVNAVIHPDDPKFDPKEFRFGNYFNNTRDGEMEFLGALLKTFPPGTSKEFIEDIIVNKNRADRGTPTKEDIAERLQGYLWEASYRLPTSKDNSHPARPTTIQVVMLIGYDENDRSTYMRVGQTRLYGQKTSIEQAEEKPDWRDTPEMLKARQARENEAKAVRQKYLGSPDAYLDKSNSNN
jgi:hypothetical protein